MARSKFNPLQLLLSAFLSSQANAGTAGGTMYYINLGGIKLLWGRTALCSLSGAGNITANFGVTFPASFFTTVTMATSQVSSYANTQFLTSNAGANPSNTSMSLSLQQTNGSNGGATMDYFVIGT